MKKKALRDIVTFTRASGATWLNSAGRVVGVDFSSSLVAASTGLKQFVLDATLMVNRGWVVGDTVIIGEQGGAISLTGTVTSYNATSQNLIVNVASVSGSGSASSWRIGSTVPRLDYGYQGATLYPNGILIEESRTNLLTYSTINTAAWSGTNGTLTNDVVASPDGTTSAARYIENTASGNRSLSRSVTITAGSTLSVSLYVKQVGATIRHFRLQVSSNSGANGFRAYFNLSSNSVDNQTTGFGTGTAVSDSATVTSVGGGWYRLSCSGTVDSGATAASVIGFMQDTPTGSAIYTGNGTSGLYVWGAQLEVGNFATSYIPTRTAAATRSADVATVTVASQWFNSEQGTVFVEAVPRTNNYSPFLQFDDGTTAETILIQGGTDTHTLVTTGSANQVSLDLGATAANITSKYAFAYKSNDFAGSLDNSVANTDTTGTVPTVTTMRLGADISNTYPCFIRQVTYYPRRVSDAQLQLLTGV